MSIALTKKEQIREAALNLFVAKGFHATKIEEIAQQAGIGKGTVYEYFSSKEALYKDIIKEGTLVFERLVAAELAQAQTTEEKLKGLIRQSLITGQRFYNLVRTTMWETIFQDSPFQAWLKEKYNERLFLIRDIIAAGIERQEIKEIDGLHFAYFFYGGLIGLVNYSEETEGNFVEREALIEAAFSYFFRGISKK